MPVARVGEINIYYEEAGRGDVLLFIMGLGMPGFAWEPQVEYFSKKYRCITFDNRGTGKSDKPAGPYSTKEMAEDAVSLLRHLRVDKAHIIGISMGGMIAQQVAINFPDIAKSAVLCATYAQADERVRNHIREGAKKLGVPLLKAEEFSSIFSSISGIKNDENAIKEIVEVLLPLTLSRDFINKNKAKLEMWMRRVFENPPTLNSFISQVFAVMTHNTLDELKKIKCPVLILTGTEDLLVPPQCSKILAENIKGSRLVEIKGGPHGLNLERAEEFNNALEDFLNSLEKNE